MHVRNKRQAGIQCPRRAASLPAKSSPSSHIIFYSQTNRTDLDVHHTSRGNWSAHQVRQLGKYGFSPELPTLVYLHAYTQSPRSQWLMDVRAQHAKLPKVQANLFLFDWSSYSTRAYGTAASWVPHLGKDLANFLDALTRHHRLNASSLHIISYSLSTHIAGVAGRQMKNNNHPIGQITALDPTGVCFHTASSEFSRNFALRGSDADLVVAKHYDMGGLGARHLIGGVDILVNGGSNQANFIDRQRARTRRSIDEISSESGLIVSGVSSHARAASHEITRDGKLGSDCQEVAYACRSYAAYLTGQCATCGPKGDKCYYVDTIGRLGLSDRDKARAYKPKTKMYLKSGAGSNSCLYLYQAALLMRSDLKQRLINLVTSGAIRLRLGSSSGGITIVPKNLVDANNDGLRFTALITQSRKMADKDYLEVYVTFNDSVGTKDQSTLLGAIRNFRLNYMSHAESKRRVEASFKFCSQKNKADSKLKRC